MLVPWAAAFALSLVVEVPLAAALLADHGRLRVGAAAFLATALTHPVLWFVAPAWFDGYWSWMVVGELGACVVEGLLLWRLVPTSRPVEGLSVSFRVNGASYLVGILAHLAGLLPTL